MITVSTQTKQLVLSRAYQICLSVLFLLCVFITHWLNAVHEVWLLRVAIIYIRVYPQTALEFAVLSHVTSAFVMPSVVSFRKPVSISNNISDLLLYFLIHCFFTCNIKRHRNCCCVLCFLFIFFIFSRP